jgi:hypothetical protein
MGRIDFTAKTKRIIASRSGYRCSFPECDNSTIGPGVKASDVVTNGVASHIYAASPGGPRGTGGLTEKELSSVENGIWLCDNHARIVDANRGAKYPPEVLLSYKALQEARIARELQDIDAPMGWAHEVVVRESPLFRVNTRLCLGKLTLIAGNNGTGKSALCGWIASIHNLEHMWRWHKDKKKNPRIQILLKYYFPSSREIEMTVSEEGFVSYSLDGVRLTMNPQPLRVVYPRSPIQPDLPKNDELKMMAAILRISTSDVLNVVPEVERHEHAACRNISLKTVGQGRRRLMLDFHGCPSGLSFSDLSAGQKERVIVEFAAGVARSFGVFQPTLLIIDEVVSMFYETWFEELTPFFIDAKIPYQTIVTIPTRKLDIAKLKWLGWEVVRTRGTIPALEVDQNIRTPE